MSSRCVVESSEVCVWNAWDVGYCWYAFHKSVTRLISFLSHIYGQFIHSADLILAINFIFCCLNFCFEWEPHIQILSKGNLILLYGRVLETNFRSSFITCFLFWLTALVLLKACSFGLASNVVSLDFFSIDILSSEYFFVQALLIFFFKILWSHYCFSVCDSPLVL